MGKMKSYGGGRLAVDVPSGWRLEAGESVAVNGVCLTYISAKGRSALFDLSPETRSRTALRLLGPGATLNLERALKLGARLGGHFVTGHIDGVVKLLSADKKSNSVELEFEAGPGAVMVEKGSVALDGVSLTVFAVTPRSFRTAVIPHTWANTSLKNLKPGSAVNIEYDILGKYARAGGAVPPRALRAAGDPALLSALKKNGFF
ncbi:MAG: riboflavin synthase [Elusimicrobia bacterium]|nr:MAG: riboflavin synthase [Elusimicrobiota bacterium]KAF0158383.1 MAG: riboflavin synthase [Elusimicrobiota bacterium]